MSLQQTVSGLRPERKGYRSRCIERYENSLRYKYIRWKITTNNTECFNSVHFMWLPWEAIVLLKREGFGMTSGIYAINDSNVGMETRDDITVKFY